MADGGRQRRHLHRRQRRLEPLIPHLQPGAIDGLFQRVASQHPKRMRHACFLRGLPNAARHFVDDDVVVRRISAQKTSDTNNRIVFFRSGKSPGSRGNLEASRHTCNRNIFLLRPQPKQPIARAQQKPFGDEAIEPRYHDREALA